MRTSLQRYPSLVAPGLARPNAALPAHQMATVAELKAAHQKRSCCRTPQRRAGGSSETQMALAPFVANRHLAGFLNLFAYAVISRFE
jgi:hypothetical protein